MSSSANPAAEPSGVRANIAQVRPFIYDEVEIKSDAAGFAPEAFDTGGKSPFLSEPSLSFDDLVAREARAREQGRQEGLAEARSSFSEQLERERSAVGEALARFTRDRTHYYEKVESEVVHLALSIARKILHREAQLDPTLLAGIVRVALEKIEGATGVSLLVNPRNAESWRNYLAGHVDPSAQPEIVEDAAIQPDRCLLRTSMGTAELGMEVQLKEIERGLMDLLAARPGEKT